MVKSGKYKNCRFFNSLQLLRAMLLAKTSPFGGNGEKPFSTLNKDPYSEISNAKWFDRVSLHSIRAKHQFFMGAHCLLISLFLGTF